MDKPDRKAAFLDDVGDLIKDADFTLIACVIDKAKLNSRYAQPENPYDVALQFCLERLFAFLKGAGQADRRTYILLEGVAVMKTEVA